jgi:hypothetical protein
MKKPMRRACTLLAVIVMTCVATAIGAPRPEPARGALAVVAIPDVLSMHHDRTAVVPPPGVLGNDLNVLGGTTVSLTSNPSHGTVSLRSDGGYTYVPNAGYVGTDVFGYRPSGLLANATTVTITITNAPPVATADSYAATAGVALQVPAPGVLGNDSDADGDTLTAAVVSSTGHGTLSFSANGAFTYTANVAYSGVDTFTYRASDGLASSAVTSVSLIVSAPPATPAPTPTPSPTPSSTPTSASPSPTSAPSTLPSVPLPSVPMPSLPMPSLPVPSSSVSASPGASQPAPSQPSSSARPSASIAEVQPGGPTGPGSSGGSTGSGTSTSSGSGSSEGGSVVIGPNGIGVRTNRALGGLAVASLGELQLWLVPGALIGGPGLLVLLWLLIQTLAGMAWLPAARRVRGEEQRRRRRTNRP